MDFDDAIVAHTAWKNKLKSYLRNVDGSLKPDDTSPTNSANSDNGFTGKAGS